MDIQNKKLYIWPLWSVSILFIWLYLLVTGPGFSLYESHWLYAVLMIFGASVAGFTPEGGGAVAFPILSLYFEVTPVAARDFSLAIQSIGMVSAAIWILTRKGHSIKTFKHVPLYAAINFLGFMIMSSLYGLVHFKIIQMMFVSLALSFIVAYLLTKGTGSQDQVNLDSNKKIIVFSMVSFIGGCASALFGTGTDMLIYIALTCFYGMKEKISTDISIVLMAIVSVFGITYRGLILDSIQPEVYYMWLAAVPVVLFFAPLGNILLGWVKKEVMLCTVLGMNMVNYLYFISKNQGLLLPTLFTLCSMFVIFVYSFYLKRGKHGNQKEKDKEFEAFY